MALPRDAMEASRTGAPLRAKNPGEVQVASAAGDYVKLLGDIFGALGKQGDRTKRVPTPIEERLVGEGEYERRQAKQAQEMLSPAGQDRFNEAGRDAQQAIRPDPTIQAAQQVIDETPVEDVVGGAREALRGMDPETMEPRPTIASVEPGVTEADAADVIRLTSEERVGDFVRGDQEGLDFNFDNLQTGDDIKAAINVVSEIFADPIKAAKRGVQTNLETLAKADQKLADELGLTRRLLKRKTGELLNAEDMTAVRMLLERSGDRLVDMAAKIRDGDQSPATLVQFRRQMALHAGIQMQAKGAQTEIARAMQAFNIPAAARSLEDIADLQKLMLDQSGGAGETIRLAKGLVKVHQAGGRQAVHKYANSGWRQVEGVFSEVYINGLLSWLPTHIKNAVGTPLFQVYQLPEEVIAGLIGGAERGVRRAVGAPRSEEGVFVGQALARMYGLSQSLKDAWSTAGTTWRTEVSADRINKVEGAQFQKITKENLENGDGIVGQFFDSLGKVVNYDKTGRVIRSPGRSLMAADDFWRVFAQRGELYSQAYAEAAMAMRRGVSQEEAYDNFAMAILDPRSYTGEMDAAARYATLTSDTGRLGKAARYVQQIPFAGKMLLPFNTAPTNGILRMAERSIYPAGLLKDPVKRQKALARIAMGWGAMYMLHLHALEGKLTGAMPRSRAQRNALPPGWKPWSAVFRGDNWPVDDDGDKLPLYDARTGVPNGPLMYVSFAGMEPVGTLLGIASGTAERLRRAKTPQELEDVPSAAIAASLEYISDIPMLAQLGDVSKALERGDYSYLASSPISGLMPFSSAIRNIERSIDPTVRRPSAQIEYHTLEDIQAMEPHKNGRLRMELVGTPKDGKHNFNRALDKWRSMLTDRPMFGVNEETSAVQYDVLGRKRDSTVRFDTNPAIATYNLLSPFDISLGKEPDEVERAQMELGGPLRIKKEGQNGFVFNDAFQSQWVNAAKNTVKIARRGSAFNFRQAIKQLVTSPQFTRQGPRESFEELHRRKRNAMIDLEDQYFDAGLRVVLNMPEYADVAEAYNDYLAQRQRQGLSQ